MKIAFVTRSMWAGGAERVISELVKYADNMGIQATIITIDNEKVLYDIPEKVKVLPIGKKSINSLFDKMLRYKILRDLVKGVKPDIVLSLPEDIGIYVIPALLGTKIPVVVSERNNPWVMPWKKESRILRKIFYPFASGIIFQTKEAASFFSAKIQKKGKILPNPLDLNRLPLPWEGERRKEIIGAGRFDNQKNFPLLIKAFALFRETHPEYSLTIYGDGNLRNELTGLASLLLPAGSFNFPGRSSELLEDINGASMFVLSSNYEGLPNVVIESMAIGVPVISTDCPSGGPAEIIKDRANGILVPVNDIDAMSNAMKELASSKELADKISRNAIQIRNLFDSNIVSQKWVNYLQDIIAKGRNKNMRCNDE
ncbi:glycosyltransferase [Bacillus sp. EB01]|uniref:glycosyltransferase n=1 Tax=Bacillus sp. EB01 TaxID=1347086 RepID=UPI0005C5154D|nr:glycosyltransferase [Bacillus sp. EB01]